LNKNGEKYNNKNEKYDAIVSALVKTEYDIENGASGHISDINEFITKAKKEQKQERKRKRDADAAEWELPLGIRGRPLDDENENDWQNHTIRNRPIYSENTNENTDEHPSAIIIEE
jgi:hypothetical protein